MLKLKNKDLSDAVTALKGFTNNNGTVYAWPLTRQNGLYVVNSYHSEWPLYVYDSSAERWFGNNSTYSTTSSRHLTQCRPQVGPDSIHWMPVDDIRLVVRHGGWVDYCAATLKGN